MAVNDDMHYTTLRREITLRQSILLALGSGVGTGLFIGSGIGLFAAGPASLLIGFIIMGAAATLTMGALGEMATAFPVPGGFYTYASRFMSPATGFTVGWLYMLLWLFVLPFELTAIGAQLRFWKEDLNPAYFVAPFLAVLAVVAFLGARWFAELEHWLGGLKSLAIIAFIFMAVVIASGWVVSDPREPKPLGLQYWTEGPGMFKNGFSGMLAVVKIATMSYLGTELAGMTAAECQAPQRVMPIITNLIFIRIAVFYICSLFMLSLVVPGDEPRLGSLGQGAKYSAFTLAAQLANIRFVDHIFNTAISAGLISMANSSIFATSRTLHALSRNGMAPRALGQLRGWKFIRPLPLWCLLVSLSFGLLAFVNIAPRGEEMFDWLLALFGTMGLVVWIVICAAHIRFCAALEKQNIGRRRLLWRTPFGVWGSYLSIIICVLGLVASVLTAVFPIGEREMKTVVRDVVGLFVPVVAYVGYAANTWHKTGWWPRLVPLEKIDLDTDRRDKDTTTTEDMS